MDHLHYIRNAINELYRAAYYENYPYPSAKKLYEWRDNLIEGDSVHAKWCRYAENKIIDASVSECRKSIRAKENFPEYDHAYDAISSFRIPASCLKKYKNSWVIYIPGITRIHFKKPPHNLRDSSKVKEIEIIQQVDLENYHAKLTYRRYNNQKQKQQTR